MNLSVCLLVTLFGCAAASPSRGEKGMIQKLEVWRRNAPHRNYEIYIFTNVKEGEDDVKKITPMNNKKGVMSEDSNLKDETQGKMDVRNFLEDLDALGSLGRSKHTKDNSTAREESTQKRYIRFR